MNTNVKPQTVAFWSFVPFCLAVCLLAVALLGPVAVSAQTPGPRSSRSLSAEEQAQINTAATEPAEAEPAARMSADELDSLVASIALYPDPLLIQVLAASTYPLEVIQLKQWMDKNKKLKGKALADAVTQKNWDPSVQALSAFPAVVAKLANDIEWTTDLGNAFLAQQDDLMDSVQTLRAKAQANGALKSNDKQTVGTEDTNNGKQAITIESAQRDVVYVPSYNTKYVYRDSGSSSSSSDSGDSSYYSGYSGDSGYSSGSDDGYSYLAYAAGAAAGAAAGYYWGNYNWRDGYAEVNYKNSYNQNWNNKNNNWSNNGNNSNNANNWNNNASNSNASKWSNNGSNSNNNANTLSNRANNLNGSDRSAQRATQGSGRWQHDPSHRGNAPYANRDLGNRMEQANNRLAGGAGNRASQASGADAANQVARGNQPSQLSRTNSGNQLARGNSTRPAGSGSARPSTRPPNGGAPNRVGNRVPSNWPSTARGGAFGPANGDVARAFSGRGAQSMGPQGAFRGGPPRGLNAGGPPMRGGPPMGGGFRGGPPGGGFPGGGPPMGGGPPPGGPPMGGAPPPPPPPPP